MWNPLGGSHRAPGCVSLCVLVDKLPLPTLLKEGRPGSCDHLQEPACGRSVCFLERRGFSVVFGSISVSLSWLMTQGSWSIPARRPQHCRDAGALGDDPLKGHMGAVRFLVVPMAGAEGWTVEDACLVWSE